MRRGNCKFRFVGSRRTSQDPSVHGEDNFETNMSRSYDSSNKSVYNIFCQLRSLGLSPDSIIESIRQLNSSTSVVVDRLKDEKAEDDRMLVSRKRPIKSIIGSDYKGDAHSPPEKKVPVSALPSSSEGKSDKNLRGTIKNKRNERNVETPTEKEVQNVASSSNTKGMSVENFKGEGKGRKNKSYIATPTEKKVEIVAVEAAAAEERRGQGKSKKKKRQTFPLLVSPPSLIRKPGASPLPHSLFAKPEPPLSPVTPEAPVSSPVGAPIAAAAAPPVRTVPCQVMASASNGVDTLAGQPSEGYMISPQRGTTLATNNAASVVSIPSATFSTDSVTPIENAPSVQLQNKTISEIRCNPDLAKTSRAFLSAPELCSPIPYSSHINSFQYRQPLDVNTTRVYGQPLQQDQRRKNCSTLSYIGEAQKQIAPSHLIRQISSARVSALPCMPTLQESQDGNQQWQHSPVKKAQHMQQRTQHSAVPQLQQLQNQCSHDFEQPNNIVLGPFVSQNQQWEEQEKGLRVAGCQLQPLEQNPVPTQPMKIVIVTNPPAQLPQMFLSSRVPVVRVQYFRQQEQPLLVRMDMQQKQQYLTSDDQTQLLQNQSQSGAVSSQLLQHSSSRLVLANGMQQPVSLVQEQPLPFQQQQWLSQHCPLHQLPNQHSSEEQLPEQFIIPQLQEQHSSEEQLPEQFIIPQLQEQHYQQQQGPHFAQSVELVRSTEFNMVTTTIQDTHGNTTNKVTMRTVSKETVTEVRRHQAVTR